jgi:hypothetical protein
MGTNAIMTAEKGFPLKFVFALESLYFYKRLRHCEASPLVIASEAKQSLTARQRQGLRRRSAAADVV